MPRTILHEVAAASGCDFIRWSRWTVLCAVAVVGSCIFGASLSWTLPGWNSSAAALWLAASAGLAWCVFIPVLRANLRLSWIVCIDACLITMACGEVVLVGGAAVNALLCWCGAVQHAAVINGIIVGISNVVMAATLSVQLRAHGVAVGRVLLLWMAALNGSGAALFGLLFTLLHG